MTNEMWIGFFLGLAGSSVGALIIHFLSKSRRNEENFKKACTKFRCAFLPEVIYLRHNANIGAGGSTDDLGTYLNSAYLRNLEAVTIFMDALTDRKKVKLESAWHTYCYHHEDKNVLNFEQYSYKASGNNRKDVVHLKALALKRIEKILKSCE